MSTFHADPTRDPSSGSAPMLGQIAHARPYQSLTGHGCFGAYVTKFRLGLSTTFKPAREREPILEHFRCSPPDHNIQDITRTTPGRAALSERLSRTKFRLETSDLVPPLLPIPVVAVVPHSRLVNSESTLSEPSLNSVTSPISHSPVSCVHCCPLASLHGDPPPATYPLSIPHYHLAFPF